MILKTQFTTQRAIPAGFVTENFGHEIGFSDTLVPGTAVCVGGHLRILGSGLGPSVHQLARLQLTTSLGRHYWLVSGVPPQAFVEEQHRTSVSSGVLEVVSIDTIQPPVRDPRAMSIDVQITLFWMSQADRADLLQSFASGPDTMLSVRRFIDYIQNLTV